MKKSLLLAVFLIVFSTVGGLKFCFAQKVRYKIPIFVYHHIVADEKDVLNSAILSLERFTNDMRYINENGYNAITFDDLIAFKEGRADLPQKPVIVTFDDGYSSNYELAYPVLKELNIKATICIIGSYVGMSENMFPHFTWAQAKEMYESGLISIQSHTYDMHRASTKGVSRLENESLDDYKTRLRLDMQKITDAIHDNLGYSPLVFAYPNCILNDHSEQIAKEIGYKVTLGLQGEDADISKSLYSLKRHCIYTEVDIRDYLE